MANPSWPADDAYPLSDTKIKDFPSGWQDILDYLEDAVERGHRAVGEENEGIHQNSMLYQSIPYLALTDAGTGAPAGRFRISLNGTKLSIQGRNSADSGWDDILYFNDAGSGVANFAGELTAGWENMEAGTTCLFEQAATPNGWSQVNTWNDRMLRVVSSTGIGTDGSWDLTGYWDLSASGGPLNHTHAFSGNTNTNATKIGIGSVKTPVNYDHFSHSHSYSFSTSTPSVTENSYHGHEVSSDSTWRPTYVDLIVCSKDVAPSITL